MRNEAKAHDAEDPRVQRGSDEARVRPQELERLAHRAALDAYPEVDFDAMAMAFNLMRAANRLTRDLEVSVNRPNGLSFAGYRLLFTIKAVDGEHPNELARLNSVSTGSMSSLLQTMDKYGLVVREADPTDGRRSVVRLSGKGEAVVADLCRANNLREQQWAEGLNSEERQTFTSLLRKLLLHHPDRRMR